MIIEPFDITAASYYAGLVTLTIERDKTCAEITLDYDDLMEVLQEVAPE